MRDGPSRAAVRDVDRRAAFLGCYISTLLGAENVEPAALEAIARGQVDWDEVARAGQHWRRCATLAAEEKERIATPKVPGSLSADVQKARQALQQTGAVLAESRIRLDAYISTLSQCSPTATASASVDRSVSPVLQIPRTPCDVPPRTLTFSPDPLTPSEPSPELRSSKSPGRLSHGCIALGEDHSDRSQRSISRRSPREPCLTIPRLTPSRTRSARGRQC